MVVCGIRLQDEKAKNRLSTEKEKTGNRVSDFP
jgi:hypothetical protein